MTERHRISELDNGLRVVTERFDSVRSVALGVMVGVGSRNETPAEAGVSHFLEHLLFKGTDRFSSLDIDQFFDGIGAEINAGTDKETTTVYARFLDRHLDSAFEMIADMVIRSTFPDVDAERKVVIEEIAMYEDEPQDKVFDQLGRAVFGDEPLGRPIIGRAEVVASTPVSEIEAFHDAHYRPGNVVVAAAGAIDHDSLVALAREARFGEALPAPGYEAAPSESPPKVCFHTKETEQVHACLGARGIARGDDRRWALRLVDTVLGGSSSSRLFQEVREKRGLAYAVYSFTGSYRDAGQIGLYVGTKPDRIAEALDVIGAELHRLAERSITADELARAKENVKGRVALAMESPSGRMSQLGASVLLDLPILTLDEIEAKIDAVTLDDAAEITGELYDPARFSAAAVGGDEERFRGALAPVSAALAESLVG